MAALVCLLAPLAVVATPAPDVVRIPIVQPRDKGDPQAAASFSHWEHRGAYCYRCHPSLFPTRSLGFTHADMEAGRFCGACHDGRTAWHVEGAGIECEICHVEGRP